ncbi:LLM class flavin-dependent oxidoreductase [Microbacterium sp. ASV49]|uniref:LLM class flavin-dependent oxidoreductase n=1 Tax=Microbacterium candidum TaxID=3041922 RepID=A0ABT7N0G3_9MICO|nr:LLM class flavin-dependent oxidoreductase [Microbacterium sp. ASV49]MDL9980187.1 LLM class flavin-dependent oxidoreductase [Microbacterium sp. ASV49]
MTSFRFGAVTAVRGDARAWGEASRRLEASGFAAVLVPDTLWTPSPFLALTAAAAATTTLRLGTWVLAAPLRTPAAAVRDIRTLVELSGGRFELGLGAGRPGAEQDAENLGVPWGTPRERVDRVEATIAAVRGALGDDLPITLAASGDRMLRLAGRHAQGVALPLPPTATVAEIAAIADRVRAATPAARPPLELSLSVAGVGDDVPEWMRRNAGVTPESLREAGAVALLSGDVARDTDALLALREATGVSFLTMSAEFADRLAPLVEALSGR